MYLNSYLILIDRKELDQVYMLDGDNTVFTYCLYFNRYLMLIDGKDQVYMVDRDNAVFHVPGLEFPRRKDLEAHLENTLVDGVRGVLSGFL